MLAYSAVTIPARAISTLRGFLWLLPGPMGTSSSTVETLFDKNSNVPTEPPAVSGRVWSRFWLQAPTAFRGRGAELMANANGW